MLRTSDGLCSAHAFARVSSLSTAHGVVEALTSAIFCGFVLWMRGQLRAQADLIQEEEDAGERLSAAHFSVIAA